MNKAVFHGEVRLVKKEISVPKSAKKIQAKNGSWIVADSETTGNHHLVMERDGCEMYEENGVLYLKNDVETTVECVMKERHDAVTLEPGVWEIKRAREYDFLADEIRNVAD